MAQTTAPDDLPYRLALTRAGEVGPMRFALLLERFGTARAAWEAPQAAWEEAGLDRRAVASLAGARRTVDPQAEADRLARAGFSAVCWDDASYPPGLRGVETAPPVLFAWGALAPADTYAVTIVGTRKPTTYGREAARYLAGELARAGVTVVSGLARGIDGAAHRAALEAGGRTVAVLGSGLDHLYPAEHRGLAAEAAARGAVLSEFPLGTRPLPAHFPRRNRLLSALGLATLVVEAAEGSGTLSTVRFALEQGRDVLCVPGSIFSETSALTNRLIGEGAKLVSGPEDVLEELVRTAALRGVRPGPGAHASEPAAPVDASEEERRVLEHLHGEPVHVDELARAVGAPVAHLTAMLAMLELRGLARSVGAMHYVAERR
jgi:DNA processing protein